MEDKPIKDEKLHSKVNQRLLIQLEENIKLLDELQNQRDFNNTLIQSTSAFFVAIQANGKLLMMNNTMLKALGYSKNEVLGKDYLLNFVPKDERESLINIFQKLSRLHQHTINENHVLTKEGKSLLVEWHGAPVFKGEEFDYFIGFGLNITKRKKAEMELRDSQMRLTSHLDNTPLACIFWDKDFKVTDWNKSAEKIFGYTKSETLGKHANDLIVPEELKEQILKTFNNLLTKTGGEKGTNENITKDGKRILCNWHNVAINDTSGCVTGVASLVDDITVRKQNILNLQKSEEKFKLLLENLPNAVYLTKLGGNNAGDIIYANSAAAKQTGYKSSDLIGMNIIKDLFVEKETISLKDKREDDLINNKTTSFIEKKKRADGTIYTTQVMITSIEYENEIVTLSVNTDITKQIEAQEKVKRSETKYKLLFENNLSPVFSTTLDGKIIECNNAFVEMFGYKSKDEILNINTNFLYRSKIARKLFIDRIKENKFISNFEVNGLKKDGTVISTLLSANLISDEIIQGTIFNITERKKYQAENLKLSRGIEQSPNMIIFTDLEGNIEYVNPKITEITGYTKEELIGENPRIFQSGKTPKKVYEELWETIQYGKTWEGELLNKRKNGEFYWENVTISPLLDNEANVLNYIGIKDDITEKKKVREELIKAKESAEEMYRMKSNFLANMSHELRTPLVGILGFTEMLVEDIKDPENKKIAKLLNENGKRLLKTLNLILDLSKIDSDALKIVMSEFDVIIEVKRCVMQFNKNKENKNISLNVKSKLDNLIIHSDIKLFYEILNNLIANGVKYTEKGFVNITVGISKNNEYVVIKVEDTGIGIPEDKQKIIWEEFRQVSEGISRNYEGTGLGLTITNKYVRKLKGKITLASKFGKGSTFTVCIPTNVRLYPTIPSES